MERDDPNAKLSELQTQTTLLYDAQNGTPEQSDAAKQLLMLRYSGAVHRYLLKAVRDPEIAKELNQEFSLKFLEGKFRQFDRSRGRFRDYLKRAVHNLMMDYFRKKKKVASQLDTAHEGAIVGDDGLKQFDEEFLVSWRQDLVKRTMNALKAHETNTGQPYWAALQLRLSQPKTPSPELAKRLGRRLGRPMSDGSFRQTLHRARDKFTQLLVDEVRVSLRNPSRAEVEEELGDLRLLEFCKPSLDRVKFQ